MQAYTLNFNDSFQRKKYFDSELRNRKRILKSVSSLISLLFLPSIIMNSIEGEYLISVSLLLWIMFHWVNIFIIKKYEIWIDYSQFINLLIALCILFQFSHQGYQLKEFESAVYGFAFQTYSTTLIMIGTNYLVDCLGQLLITFGFFLVMNLEISFSNCIILLFAFIMICQVKYQVEKSKRLVFFFKEKEKKLSQSLRDTMPSAMIIIKHKPKENSMELITQNELFQKLQFGVKDNSTLSELTNKLFIKKEVKFSNGDKVDDLASWEDQSQKQFVSLNSYLHQYCQALQKKEACTKQQKNALLYLLDSQFGIVDCDRILKNNVEEFVGIIQSDSIQAAPQNNQKRYKLRIGFHQNDKIHCIIFIEEIQSAILGQIKEQHQIIKSYQHSTDIIYKKIIKNLGYVIIGTNSLISQVQNDALVKAQVVLHKTVTSLNYVYNLYDYLSFPQNIFQLKISQFSLQSLILDLKSVYQSVLQQSHICFQIECESSISNPESFMLNTDKRRIIQSLINLINLALRSIHQNKKEITSSICKRNYNYQQASLNKPQNNIETNSNEEYLKIIFSLPNKNQQNYLKISIRDSGVEHLIQKLQSSVESSLNNINSLNMSNMSYYVTSQILKKLGPEDKIVCKSVKKIFNKTSFKINTDYNNTSTNQQKVKEKLQYNQQMSSLNDLGDAGFKLSQRAYSSQHKIYLSTENDEVESPISNNGKGQKLKDNQLIIGRCSVQSDTAIPVPNENLTQYSMKINPVLVSKSNFQNTFMKSNSSSPPIIRKDNQKSIQFVQSPQICDEISIQMKHLVPQLNRISKQYSCDRLGYDQNDSHLKFNDKDISYNQTSFFTDCRDVLQMTMNDNNMTYYTSNIIQDTYGSKQVDPLNQNTAVQFQESYLSKKL